MSKIKISFILPCYNVERYVRQCVDSILSISLPKEEYEIICVNDCSQDDTLTLLHAIERENPVVRVISLNQNKGLSGARNEGLMAARGQYIWFVDSDDTIIPQEVNKFLDEAISERLDVLCFNYRRVGESGQELQLCKVFENNVTEDGYTFVNRVFGPGVVNHMGYVWRFWYRREYLLSNNFFFPEGVCWEDTVFMPETMLCAERIASISSALYNYRVNPSSISGTFGRVYPARLIYEFAFSAGGDLISFSKRVNDAALADSFFQLARKKYINGFLLHLCRTSKKERHLFYQIINDCRKEVRTLYPYMNLTSRAILMPYVGKLLTECFAIGYKFKHGK